MLFAMTLKAAFVQSVHVRLAVSNSTGGLATSFAMFWKFKVPVAASMLFKVLVMQFSLPSFKHKTSLTMG